MKEKDEFKHDGREGSKPFVTIRVVKMPFNLFQPFWQIYIYSLFVIHLCVYKYKLICTLNLNIPGCVQWMRTNNTQTHNTATQTWHEMIFIVYIVNKLTTPIIFDACSHARVSSLVSTNCFTRFY